MLGGLQGPKQVARLLPSSAGSTKTVRIPRTPEGPVPPPDETALLQIVGRPSGVCCSGQVKGLQKSNASARRTLKPSRKSRVEAEGFASAAEAAASDAFSLD